MYKIGFDNEKYLKMQSEKILERIDAFGGKLYLEFGGKLFDDYHASRVLPGFHPDSKINMHSPRREPRIRTGHLVNRIGIYNRIIPRDFIPALQICDP